MYDPKCTKCTLHTSAKVVCFPGTGNKAAKVMLIASYPSADDENLQLQMKSAGESKNATLRDNRGSLVIKALRAVGIKPSSCYITYGIKCKPPFLTNKTERNKIVSAAGKICPEYLRKEIAAVQPDVIVCLGKVVQQVVLGMSTSIEVTHGKVYDYKLTTADGTEHTIPTIPVYDPVQVFKQPNKKEAWLTDFRHVRGLLLGETPYFTPDKLKRFTFRQVTGLASLKQAVDSVKDGDVVAMDIEATGLDEDMFQPGYRVLSVQFGAFNFDIPEDEKEEVVWFVPFNCKSIPYTQDPSWQSCAREELNRLFSKKCTFVFHNGKYDVKGLRHAAKIEKSCVSWDTMMAHALLHGESSSSLKALAYWVSDLGGYDTDVDQSKLEEASVEDLFNYGCLDIVITKKLYRRLRKEYNALSSDDKLKFTIDYLMDIVSVFTDIELEGFPFDTEIHRQFIATVEEAYIEAEKEFLSRDEIVNFLRVTGEDKFNMNSNLQVRKLLFGKEVDGGLGLTPVKVSPKTGDPSADANTLDILAKQGSEVAEKLRAFRKLAKVKSSFCQPYIDYYDSETGAIHTTYFLAKVIDDKGNMGGAGTGRLCVKGDTKILTNEGFVEIQHIDVSNNNQIYLFSGKGTPRRITANYFKGYEEMYNVTLSNGKSIICTAGHRLLTARGWVSVAMLRDTDRVLSYKEETLDQRMLQEAVGGKHAFNAQGCREQYSFGSKSYTGETVKSIVSVGIHGVYDITVDEDACYLAHGMVHHNSSKSPNLQQIPKRDSDSEVSGKLVRKSFVSRPGKFLVEIDQSQIELRVAAMYSQDKNMTRFFVEGGDFHTRTASEIHGVAMDDVTKPMRQAAKSINFGILFGMGTQKLMRQTGMPEDDAQAFLKNYFKLFPQLMQWREDTIALAERQGFVVTLFGRKRVLKFAGYKTDDAAETRQGVNTPIQSSAADITLYGIREIWKDIKRNNLRSRLIGSIHDSAIMLVDYLEAADFLKRCVYNMTEPAGLRWLLKLGVPLSVGIDVGNNLYTVQELPLEEVLAGTIDYRSVLESMK